MRSKREKALCFVGDESAILYKDDLQVKTIEALLLKEIDQAIEKGIETFYFGACYGFSHICANAVLVHKMVFNNLRNIQLIAVVPYEEQAKDLSEKNRKVYYNTLAHCDKVITLNTKYKQGCYEKRTRYMIDHSSQMICYYEGYKGSGEYPLRYAEKNKLQIVNLYDSIK
ncbi:putative phage-like protein YoqJ [Natranaerovirga pectinivora]|uniref:Putative phage-like protein YoqJ n=1 Tax=Natranaerovirga pectinivora TaxID=682400 RepID=A0A4R3MNN8_9FIRM|nr:SLOG family protein [Natranaerovirga pectinivora]TCT15654.1 putative phage-like protein YoqJ [Natranaerovirga pectinivora]